MNVVSWIAIIILLLSILNGFRRGLVNSVFSTFSFVIAIAVAAALAPKVNARLMESPYYRIVNSGVVSTLSNIQPGTEEAAEAGEEQNLLIESLPLPEYARQSLMENNNVNIYETLGVNAFQSYLGVSITRMIVNGTGFVLVFLVVFVALKLLGLALDLASRLPVIGAVNRVGGLFFGLVNGIFILWMVCSVATLLGGTELAQYIYRGLNTSSFLSLFYNHNYLLELLSRIRR